MMTDAPLFSIITITKDNPDGFQSTSHSIGAQAFQSFEWIVVNGGAPFETAAIAIHEPDNGIYDAMNKGMTKAKGEYLLFLNAGDRLSDLDILRTIAAAIELDRPDILYGDALETGMVYKKARPAARIDFGMITHHQSILYKRELVNDLRYDQNYTIAADYDFTRKAISKAKTIHYLPAAICIFETGGISQRNAALGRQQEFIIRQCGGVPLLKNHGIRLRQFCANIVKSLSPKIYRALRPE